MAGVNPFDRITISGTREIKPLPHIPGAETSGEIEKIREHVSRLNKGDRVIVYNRVFDGTCDMCLNQFSTVSVILAGLIGAIVWDLLTWYFGLQSSSSHALIGGLVGSALIAGGLKAIVFHGIQNTLIFMVVSPISGFAIVIIYFFQKSSLSRVNKLFGKLHLHSSLLPRHRFRNYIWQLTIRTCHITVHCAIYCCPDSCSVFGLLIPMLCNLIKVMSANCLFATIAFF